jgi:hypothetical protein
MILYLKLEQVRHRGDDRLYPGITKFMDMPAIHADQMIMLFKAEGLFILGKIFAKLVFLDHITVNQQLERIIHGSPAHPVIFILHLDIQRLSIKVISALVDRFEDGISLRSLTKSAFVQVRGEDVFDLIEIHGEMIEMDCLQIYS